MVACVKLSVCVLCGHMRSFSFLFSNQSVFTVSHFYRMEPHLHFETTSPGPVEQASGTEKPSNSLANFYSLYLYPNSSTLKIPSLNSNLDFNLNSISYFTHLLMKCINVLNLEMLLCRAFFFTYTASFRG